MWFVVRKRSKHRTIPPQCHVVQPQLYLQHHLSMCGFLIKIRQSSSFRISTQMRKNFMWKFRLLSSTAMTPGIIQIMRLIFVLESFNFRYGKRFDVSITCEKVLLNERVIFNIDFKLLFQ